MNPTQLLKTVAKVIVSLAVIYFSFPTLIPDGHWIAALIMTIALLGWILIL